MSRLQKLLSMLGSEQPGEADAARRKLLDHLGHHRLSLTDVAGRLRTASAAPATTEGPSLWLQRELHVARVARQEAEFDVKRAQQRLSELSRSLQEAGVDVARASRGVARARVAAAVGWTLALVAGAGLLVPLLRERPPVADQSAMLLRPADPDAVGLRYGTVLVQDLAVRLTPNAEGEVRAFLNRGTRVVLERQVQLGTEQWLRIRSVSGDGWVRGSDVMH